MGRYRPAVRYWIAAVALAAAAVTAATLRPHTAGTDDWLTFALITLCAALANVFPIKSASDGASLRLTNVFIIGGAVILPPGLLSLLPAFAIAPDLWLHRRRPRGRLLLGWTFNVAQTILAIHAAGAVVSRAGGLRVTDVHDLAVLVGATVAFTVTQELLVGVVIALSSRIPITRVPIFGGPTLLSSLLIGVLAIATAGIWLARPAFLVVIPPILFIAHRMTRTAQLAHLAEVDSKTGLHNSQYFEGALERELAHSLRVGRPLALLFADLDHFKRINDQYGHAAGDAVLREFSALLAGTVRKGDIVARFGGEEFVILLPGTDATEATYLAERLRTAVEEHDFPLPGGATVRCTISIGIATCPDDATELKGLLQRADAAMYRAKQLRNAVSRSSVLPAVPRLHGAATPGTPAEADGAGAASQTSSEAGSQSARSSRARLRPLVLWGVVAGGAAAAGWSLALVQQGAGWAAVLPFLLITIGADFLKVQVYETDRQQRLTLSFSTAATMAVVAAQPVAAPLVMAITAAVHVAVLRQRQVEKALFNLANPALAAGAASLTYAALRPAAGTFTIGHLGAGLAAALVFYLLNDGLLYLMISLHTGTPLGTVVRGSGWYGPTKLFLGLTGAFVGGSYPQLGPVGVLMFVAPVLLMRFTLSFYAQRTQRHIEMLQAAKAEVEQAHGEKEEILRRLIETVALIIDARDNSVSGHSRRVARFAVAIGRELGLNPSELAVIHTAGLFHDLGKVGIPEAILHKPGRLTPEEYEVIKQHAGLGRRILSEVPQLADIAQMVGEHHERFDGTGYPKGMQGAEISIGGRILVVADALETMLTDRPYSSARSLAAALDELERCAGTQFDPAVVKAAHRAVRTLGADFFTGPEKRTPHDWKTADRILSEVFA
jgi:diguanylate cyclase (GGDEF)-like protein/putative nucleotidyltransferase with HDIG domain